MKNVIKIALLSTAAMVGTAHAAQVQSAVEAANAAIASVYSAAGITGGANDAVDAAAVALRSQVEKVYGAEITVNQVTGFDWTTYTTITEDVTLNTDDLSDPAVTDFSTEIGTLTDAIKVNVWGSAGTLSGIEGLETVRDANSGTVNTQAGTLFTNIGLLDQAILDFNDAAYADKDITLVETAAINLGTASSAFKSTADGVVSATSSVSGFDWNSIGDEDSFVVDHTTAVE